MKKLIIATVLIYFSLPAFATETIRFSAEASYPPFVFMNADSKMQGFDIDLANALCSELKAECVFTHQAFDSLIPALKFRRTDAIIGGIDITPERRNKVAFTQPYYKNSALFITMQGKFTQLSALNGKTVGIQNGTTHQKFLQDKHPEMKAIPYDSYQNAILDLKNGRLDAVFGDTAVVNEWIKHNKQLTSIDKPITDPDYFGTGLGIAVRLENTELLNKINAALHKLHQNGTWQNIYQKWFPE